MCDAMTSSLTSLTADDHAQLARARAVLTGPSLIARMSALVGRPSAALVDRLPESARHALMSAASLSLDKAFVAARASLGADSRADQVWLHRGLAATSGAVGGLFGLSATLLELPVSTVIMMRAIAAKARAQGEDLQDPDAVCACLEVFALGSAPQGNGDGDALSYFALRSALANSVADAARAVGQNAAAAYGGPAVSALIHQVARYFGVAVSHKAAATLLPIVGAVGGAGVNVLFTEHLQTTAEAHFTLRRLERRHGAAAVRHYFDRTAATTTPSAKR